MSRRDTNRANMDRCSHERQRVDETQKTANIESVRRMEEIIQGQTAGLTEVQFRRTLG